MAITISIDGWRRLGVLLAIPVRSNGWHDSKQKDQDTTWRLLVASAAADHHVLLGCSVLIGPDASVMTSWLWNLLNVGVALVGYHLAAFTIDWKVWGRKRMQVCACWCNQHW